MANKKTATDDTGFCTVKICESVASFLKANVQISMAENQKINLTLGTS
jgi:hypothetical protein